MLPLGATEPHNLHLPYGTDLFEGQLVGEKICEAAYERGANVVLLPTIPYGTQTNMLATAIGDELESSTLESGREGSCRVAGAAAASGRSCC